MADEDEGEKVYKCGHCGMTSRSIEDLKFHMLGSHLNEAGSIVHGRVENEVGNVEVVDESVNLPMVSESRLC